MAQIIKFIDLFAGVGGFRYGLEMCNQGKTDGESLQSAGTKPNNTNQRRGESHSYVCVYSNEWDKYANSVYRKQFGECDDRDIRTIVPKEIPEFDLLVGGFPCQSFSVAGRRRGFADTRGTLFFEVARIVKERKPRLLLLENVKGLLSHDEGETFRIILLTLDELGYDCQWQVLNSKDFGVPQNRERVYIVANLRGTPRPEVFPITSHNPEAIKPGETVEQRTQVYIATRQLGRNGPLTSELSGTLQAIESPHVTDGMKVRKLTPVECERLQGFPDDWTKFGAENESISDTQRYKMMGNAVTTNVIAAIAKKLVSKGERE